MSEDIQTLHLTLTSDTIAGPCLTDQFVKSVHDTTLALESLPVKKIESAKSIFTHHLLKPHSKEPLAMMRPQADWTLALIVLWVSIIAWIRFFYGKRFGHLLLAPFSRRSQNQLLREGDLFSERLSVAAGFVYFIGISLLIYQIQVFEFQMKMPLRLNSLTLYLLILVLVIVYWLGKVMMMLFLSSVFKTKSTTREYLVNILVLNSITGVVLLPAVILIIYLQSHMVLYITLSIIALLYIFRFIKGFLTGLSLTKFSYIFLFVYLCTLEIVPMILVIKFSIIYYSSKVPVN